jgi:hypothetical protein
MADMNQAIALESPDYPKGAALNAAFFFCLIKVCLKSEDTLDAPASSRTSPLPRVCGEPKVSRRYLSIVGARLARED